MVLSDREITQYCTSKQLLSPFHPKYVNPASIDIRLGSSYIYIATNSDDVELGRICTAQYEFTLRRGDLVLFDSVEELNMPDDLGAQLALKSTIARQGINHSLAGWVDPGFKGKLTLELFTLLEQITLVPGQRIAQLVFYKLLNPCTVAYNGRYQHATTVEAAKEGSYWYS